MKIKFVHFLLFAIIVVGFALRIYKVNNTSLFGDELDFGYQALSFVETGKDYFGNSLPVYFHSLSEWKTGAFIYILSPFVGLFGINEFSIRLPSIIFGSLTILFIYLLTNELTGRKFIAITSAFLLAVIPWHLHYSRIGFEVSVMFFAYVTGIFLFYKGINNNKLLPISAFLLAISFVVYRTQLIFVPTSLFLLVLFFRKELLTISKKYLLFSGVVFLLITIPYIYQTFLGPGSERFSVVSVFDSEKMNNEIGILRLEDAKYQKADFFSNISNKLFHNKYVYFSNKVLNNFLSAYSSEFLFISGDFNLRQGIPGWGELYKYQIVLLALGMIFFADTKISKKSKILVLSWLIFAPLSASLTEDGGKHATRLFMMILPLTIISSYGVYFLYTKLPKKTYQRVFLIIFIALSLFGLKGFLHDYFVHYPASSEQWWHSGFKEATKAVILEKDNYDKIIISSANEPAQIFFLAWSAYSPKSFQSSMFSKKTYLEGFGEVSELDKFLFPEVGVGKGLYDLPKDLPNGYLYLATAKEISLDLITEPERLPNELKLIKTITYPSGRPVFYLFSKK